MFRHAPKLNRATKALFRAVLQEKNVQAVEAVFEKFGRAADPDALDEDGFAILHHIALANLPVELLDCMVRHGASVDVRNIVRETPLIIAAIYSHHRIVERLLAVGANVLATDVHGYTAVSRATAGPGFRKEDRDKVVAMLEAASSRPREGEKKKTSDEIVELANAKFRSGDIPGAAHLYQHALEADESNWRAHSNLSQCLLAAERFKEALHHASQSTLLNPENEKGWWRLVKAQMGIRDFPRARTAAERGLEHCPKSADIQALLDLMISRGVPDRASGMVLPEEAEKKLKSGCPTAPCAYCRRPCPLPLEARCPWCRCDPAGVGMP